MSANLKVCVLVLDEGKVLLVKEWSERKNVFAWNVIKGTMDKEGESVFECAVREALEEASLRIELDESLGVHINDYGLGKRTVYFMFTAKIVGGEPAIADKADQEARGEDIAEIKWFSLYELSKLKKEDFVAEVSFKAVQKLLNKETVSLHTISTGVYKV